MSWCLNSNATGFAWEGRSGSPPARIPANEEPRLCTFRGRFECRNLRGGGAWACCVFPVMIISLSYCGAYTSPPPPLCYPVRTMRLLSGVGSIPMLAHCTASLMKTPYFGQDKTAAAPDPARCQCQMPRRVRMFGAGSDFPTVSVLELAVVRLVHWFSSWMCCKSGHSFHHAPMTRFWGTLCSRGRSAAMASFMACIASQLRGALLRPSSLQPRIRSLS